MASRAAQRAYRGPRATDNIIENGAMEIAQRTSTVTVTSATVGMVLDRWCVTTSSNAITATQVETAPENFRYSMRVQRTAGDTGTAAMIVEQAIETSAIARLRGKQATVSFYALAGASSSVSSLRVYFMVGTGTEGRRGVSSFTSELIFTNLSNASAGITTSAWTRFTATTGETVPSNATQAGFQIYFNPTGTAGADDSFYITGVQIEPGGLATDFHHEDAQTTLDKCRRHYVARTETLNSRQIVRSHSGLTSGTDYHWIEHPVHMRVQPSNVVSNITYQSASGLGTANPTRSGVEAYYTVTSSGSAYVFFDLTSSAEMI